MQATGSIVQRSMLALAVLLTAVGVPGMSGSAMAQAAIECESVPSSSAATPAAAPATPAAPQVEFPESGELTVFGAASLTDVYTQIGDDIMAAHPGITITFNFAGSQALATQLTQGAPADVFASANPTQMQVALDAGVIDGEPQTFTRNRLAIVVPSGNPAGLDAPADLAQEDLRIVLAQPEVPVGRYSRQALCNMGRDQVAYGDGFVEQVAGNVVSQEEDVRAVLTKVQLGEADAGMVYVSDITEDVASDVEIIEIPEAVNVIASYPIAPVEGGDTALANAFIAYVLGPEGQATLENYGFTPLP